MYKSLVIDDEFLAQGLHLKSHQRILQTSQVLPPVKKCISYIKMTCLDLFQRLSSPDVN